MRGGLTPSKLRGGKKVPVQMPQGIDPQNIGVRSAFEVLEQNRISDSDLNGFIGGPGEIQVFRSIEHGPSSPELDVNNPDQLAPGLQPRFAPHFPVDPFAWSIESIAPDVDLDIFNGKSLPDGRFYLDDLLTSLIRVSGTGENTFIFYVGDKEIPNERLANIQGDLWANLGANSIREIFWAGVTVLSGGGGFGDPDEIVSSEALLIRNGLIQIESPKQTIRVLNASPGRTFRMAGVAFLTEG